MPPPYSLMWFYNCVKTKICDIDLRLRWHWKQGQVTFVTTMAITEKFAMVLKWSLYNK